MVTTHHIRPHTGVTKIRHEAFGNHKVIKTPAHVFGAAVSHEGPEGVFSGFLGVQLTESIDKSGVQKLGEVLPLLIGEAWGFVPVVFRVGEIDVKVSNV